MPVALRHLGGDAPLFTDPNWIAKAGPPAAQPLLGARGQRPLAYLLNPLSAKPGHVAVQPIQPVGAAEGDVAGVADRFGDQR